MSAHGAEIFDGLQEWSDGDTGRIRAVCRAILILLEHGDDSLSKCISTDHIMMYMNVDDEQVRASRCT